METNEILTRTECSALRGLAIIGIFLHNYCHWLPPAVQENEYQYFQENVDAFNHALMNPDWNLPVHFLSFFGHYGVPVFLFLSAYGLVMKYERQPAVARVVKTVPFLRYHFLKLFRMMIVGFVAFTMLDQITPGSHHYQLWDVVAQLGLFNNLLPHPDDIIWPGPYWFFGLMLQLYAVYRLLLYRRSDLWTIGSIGICVIGQFFFDPEGDAINRYRYNFMGSMLPFGFGLLFARWQKKIASWRDRVGRQQFDGSVLVLSAVFTYVFSLNFVAWAFVPLFVCTFSIALVKLLGQGHFKVFDRGLVWMGGISASLFVCHPLTRKIFIPISRHWDIYTGLLLYVVASICLAWLWEKLMRKIPKPKLK